MALQVFPDISKKVSLSDGTNYAYIRIPAVDSTKPTFLLLHGFPSSSYDWRHIVLELRERGYGVIAPDLLGYGDTDKPVEVAEYSFKRMGNDVAELIHIENLDKVIGVGHDWGAGLLSAVALLHPHIFSGLVFMGGGYVVPGIIDIDAMNSFTEQIFGYPTFGYWKFFNEDSAADVLDANPASITSLLYPTVPEDWKATMGPYGAAKSFVNSGRVTPLPVWLSEGEARTRNMIFEKGGYTGPLNWYKSAMRGIDIPWKTSSLAADDQKSLDIPTVLVPGEHDYVCRLELQKPIAEKFLRNYRIEQFQCGHWIQHEKRDELVKLLEEFSGSL